MNTDNNEKKDTMPGRIFPVLDSDSGYFQGPSAAERNEMFGSTDILRRMLESKTTEEGRVGTDLVRVGTAATL